MMVKANLQDAWNNDIMTILIRWWEEREVRFLRDFKGFAGSGNGVGGRFFMKIFYEDEEVFMKINGKKIYSKIGKMNFQSRLLRD